MILCFLMSCVDNTPPEQQSSTDIKSPINTNTPTLSIDEANQLIELPLHCVEVEFPNKLNQTIGSEEDLGTPSELHPIFYGCFDWHSAVHGYWSMVTLLKSYPNLEKAEEVKTILSQNLTSEKVAAEVAYFNKALNKSYERTYGWAWLLKLAEALHTWDDPMATELETNLQPLTNLISERYLEFLPKLIYPIRVGEHSNTAFGLSFAYDYAVTFNDVTLKNIIEQRARDYYTADLNCPLSWEPSGFDFLSPCFEEIDLMRKVLGKEEFKSWLAAFMPQLLEPTFSLDVAEVSDRSDGKLVHLDGLNFSRAWVLYGLIDQYPEYSYLVSTANEHFNYSYPNLVGDSYEGGHWLGSFAIYALQSIGK